MVKLAPPTYPGWVVKYDKVPKIICDWGTNCRMVEVNPVTYLQIISHQFLGYMHFELNCFNLTFVYESTCSLTMCSDSYSYPYSNQWNLKSYRLLSGGKLNCRWIQLSLLINGTCSMYHYYWFPFWWNDIYMLQHLSGRIFFSVDFLFGIKSTSVNFKTVDCCAFDACHQLTKRSSKVTNVLFHRKCYEEIALHILPMCYSFCCTWEHSDPPT